MTDEHDEQFERLMRDAAHTYHRPPEIAPLDEMWAAIEQGPGSVADYTGEPRLSVAAGPAGRTRSWTHRSWLRTAAVLAIGIGLGRASSFTTRISASAPPPETPTVTASLSEQDRQITNAYLGQAAALLISLPSELQRTRRDTAFVSRADNLLLETRLLLGSPSSSDPALHALFQDLEVVLAQVVRLRSDRDPMEVDLVTSAIEKRDVLPRLRLAVVDHIAN